MKERELRKIIKCSMCKRKALETGLPLFYRVRIERYGVRLDRVRRQAGLEAMMGGRVALAQVMGPDEDLAEPVMSPVNLTVCEACAMKDVPLALLVESGKGEDEAPEGG